MDDRKNEPPANPLRISYWRIETQEIGYMFILYRLCFGQSAIKDLSLKGLIWDILLNTKIKCETKKNNKNQIPLKIYHKH